MSADRKEIAEHFLAIAAIDPEAVEVTFKDKTYRWKHINVLADAMIGALREGGVPSGLPIAWVARNDPNLIAAAFGLLVGGNCISPVNPHVPNTQLAATIRSFNMAAIVGVAKDLSPEVVQAAREIGAVVVELDIDADPPARALPGFAKVGAGPHRTCDPDVVLERISSGTTGEPKRFEVLAAAFLKAVTFAGTSESPSEVRPLSLKRSAGLAFNTFAHSSGLWRIITALHQGRPIDLHEKFTVEAWVEAVQRVRPKLVNLVPAMINMILEADVPKDAFSSLLAVRTGSAPLDTATQKHFEQRFGIPILIDYGASEFMGGIASWSLADRRAFGDSKMGSVGRLRTDLEAKVIDQDSGEEQPTGSVGVLMLKTARHGPSWVQTTDLASIDEDGFLFLHGRADEAINRGGFKVLPELVANVLKEHRAVREAAVLAIKDRRLGQVPLAIIEAFPGTSVAPSELEAFVRERMPPYFVPVAFEFVETMPRTNSLKISRPALKDLFAERYPF